MKAITLHGTGDVRVESVPDARVVDPTDVVVRITTSAICGSDLHQYHGRVPGLPKGVVLGHEFMGVVEAVGGEVKKVRKGDRIIAPFSISCGFCEWCRMRLPTQCTTTGRAVFGGRFGVQYPGGQAEAIRVPFADHMCEKVPEGMADEEAFFLGDILSTGYCCAENAGVAGAVVQQSAQRGGLVAAAPAPTRPVDRAREGALAACLKVDMNHAR